MPDGDAGRTFRGSAHKLSWLSLTKSLLVDPMHCTVHGIEGHFSSLGTGVGDWHPYLVLPLHLTPDNEDSA